MPFPDFRSYPIWLNLGIFTLAAGVTWLVGTRLSAYADVIAERTGLGKAFIGLVMLAVVTSLPEIGTTATAVLTGNPSLAVNNLFGGVVMQTAILAVADFVVAAGALTFFTPQAALLLEGASLIVLLAIALAASAAGPTLVLLGVSIWSPLLGGAYLLSVYLLWHYQGRAGWQPVDVPESAEQEEDAPRGEQDRYADRSTARLGLSFALGGLMLLAAGWAVASAAEAIAHQTGLGTSFVGATLVAASTSLPEVSTTIAAVRLGSYAMAISNIFGSNAIDTALLFFADVLYREGSIFTALDQSSSFAAAAAIVVTAVYLIGLIERRNLVILRMGVDSAAVLALYAGTVFILYQLR